MRLFKIGIEGPYFSAIEHILSVMVSAKELFLISVFCFGFPYNSMDLL